MPTATQLFRRAARFKESQQIQANPPPSQLMCSLSVLIQWSQKYTNITHIIVIVGNNDEENAELKKFQIRYLLAPAHHYN